MAMPALEPQPDRAAEGVMISGYPLTGLVRRCRRTADMSQRELARYAHVSPSTIGEIEAGTLLPSLPTLQRVLNAANYQLVIADADGRLVVPLLVWQDVADGAGRRYPAHLDTILDPEFGEWWADGFGLTRPPETFRRNRAYRDHQRRLSEWEVRVAKYRHDPQPKLPLGWKRGDEWLADP